MSEASEKREQQSGYVFLADSYYDGDGERRNLIGRLLYTGHQDVLWANHRDDADIKDHTHVLWREKYSTSISAVAFRYNHPARLIQVVGRDADHKNYKGAMIYLLHIDRKSVAQGKRKYNTDVLYGPWKEKAVEVIHKYQEEHKNHDNDIILILDWIDAHVNCTTADLVRWCCANNLYSVYRRSASVVNAVLRELRDVRRTDDYIAGIGNRLAEVERRADQLAESRKNEKHYREIAQSTSRVNVEILQEMMRQYYENRQQKMEV